MTTRTSIAQAKDRLPQLVHDVEAGQVVEITRRGEVVAVLLSRAEYVRLQGGRRPFWDAVVAYRRDLQPGLNDDDLRGLRDPSPGRDVE